VKGVTGYRMLGGGIEFGETGAEAVARELREELGATALDVRYLTTVENIFTYLGERGHEIVRVYEARLAERELYGREPLPRPDGGGPTQWRRLADFDDRTAPLYPQGILAFLLDSGERG
jgi:ADP-ribose pyrophosphatase YjhB (NUDIX family)